MLVIAAAAAVAIWPSAAALECEGLALDDGCLFTITGGDTADPDDGFAVTNTNGVPLWDFVRERDLQGIGYPISQRWVDGPFTLQAFQKVILQWDPGKGRMNYYNTLDVLANRYPEVELANVPPHQVLEADRGSSFGAIIRNHLALLDQNPAIRERFLSEPDWLDLYGLPIRYEEREVNGNPQGLQMLRAQRTVFVIWNVPAPGTTVGRVNLQNVPDKVKRLSNVIIPDVAKAPLTRDALAWMPRFALPTPAPPPPPPRAPWPASDRDALVQLYHATDGPNWKHRTNWLSGTPLGEWHGVQTNRDGRVTALWLNENQLSGEIPSALGSLPQIRRLSLSDNQLSGEIPPELGNLPNLRNLNLWKNRLSGAIPSELSRLANLQTLWLSHNRLSGTIPRELSRLANLEWLELDANQLSGEIPWELSRMTSLEWLILDENRLTGTIPGELGRLTRLEWLNLGENQLRGAIPRELGRLSRLTRLWLEENHLTGTIPPALGNLANLQSLILRDNQLSGTIPAGLGSHFDLRRLDLARNQLTGAIPAELGRLSNLEVLHLRGNHLSGAIPSELGRLANLAELTLGEGNQLTGCIPHQLRTVATNDLAQVGLPFCAATDSGPAETPAPDRDRDVLVTLYHATGGPNWANNSHWLSESAIGEWHGVITDHMGRVVELQLAENRLVGEIPPELGDLGNLRELILYRNQLTGSIPRELSRLAQLRRLGLDGNQLSGTIPPELGRLANLQDLSLPANQLTGAIPPELIRLANLRSLDLARNHLSGPIPPELGGIANCNRCISKTISWMELSRQRWVVSPTWIGWTFPRIS